MKRRRAVSAFGDDSRSGPMPVRVRLGPRLRNGQQRPVAGGCPHHHDALNRKRVRRVDGRLRGRRRHRNEDSGHHRMDTKQVEQSADDHEAFHVERDAAMQVGLG
jgi:hypothetical protein